MTTKQLYEAFERHHSEYMRHERIPAKFSNRADLHAFIRLDMLVPGGDDIVCHSSHDEITLAVSPADLAAALTDESLIIELLRCGVRLNRDHETFTMYV